MNSKLLLFLLCAATKGSGAAEGADEDEAGVGARKTGTEPPSKHHSRSRADSHPCRLAADSMRRRRWSFPFNFIPCLNEYLIV